MVAGNMLGCKITARRGVYILLPRALERDHIGAGNEQTNSPRGQRWNVALLPQRQLPTSDCHIIGGDIQNAYGGQEN